MARRGIRGVEAVAARSRAGTTWASAATPSGPMPPASQGSLTVDRAADARANTIGAYYRCSPALPTSMPRSTRAAPCSAQPPHMADGCVPTSVPAPSPYQGRAGWSRLRHRRLQQQGFLGAELVGQGLGQSRPGAVAVRRLAAERDGCLGVQPRAADPQIWHLPPTSERNRSGIVVRPDRRAARSPGISSMSMTVISRQRALLEQRRRRQCHCRAGGRQQTEIPASAAVYAHGGLNSPADSARRIAAMKRPSRERYLPITSCNDTGILEEVKDVILRRSDPAGGTGAVSDWTDRLLEWGTRIPDALWRG